MVRVNLGDLLYRLPPGLLAEIYKQLEEEKRARPEIVDKLDLLLELVQQQGVAQAGEDGFESLL